MARENAVMMEGVRIIFRNFAGKEGQYNREGDRNFSVLLDPETADAMARDGWNVKFLKVREEDEIQEPQAYLPVSVNFSGPRPPKVVMVTSRGRTFLSEDEVELLDWADIINVDLTVNPYHWTIKSSGASGIKAYLQTLYVTINEDPLDLKYAELDDLNSRSGRTEE